MRRSIVVPVTALAASVLFPCAIDDRPLFFPQSRPEQIAAKFVHGEIGILTPTLGKKYLLIAWRYLSGRPLDAAEQAALTASTPPRTFESSGLSAWRKIANNRQLFFTSKASVAAKGAYYENCLDDSFATAAATYESRKRSYPSEALVAEWLQAQNRVFENCSGVQPEYPADPEPSLALLAKEDRLYQIAAAHFYAEDFDGAEQRFTAIAADADSPWRATAAYMIGRTLLREYSLLNRSDALPKARAIFLRVGSDSARGLIDHIDALAHPEEVFASLGRRLAEPGAATAIDEAVYAMKSPRFEQTFTHAEMPEPFDWIRTIESNANGRALEQWRAKKSALWLAAALMIAKASDAAAPELIEAANALPESSPAFDTAMYYSIGLMIQRGDRAAARSRLDRLLARSSATLDSVANARRGQRMRLATSFDDFLRWAPRNPIGTRDPMDDDTVDRTDVLDSDSLEVLNTITPLAKLAEAAGSSRLPSWIQGDIAGMAWMRAFILLDDRVAGSMIPIVAKSHADWRADIQNYRESPAAQKRFAGALLILRHSDFRPYLLLNFHDHAETGSWWCAMDTPNPPVSPPIEAIPADERAQASREFAQLEKAGPDEQVLGPIVLDWAKSHPADLRVPEALALLVRVTRLGCRAPGSTNAAVSKAAFDILHRRYPKSDWTAKTPYWFP